MLGASDLISIMRTEGAANNPPTVQLGTMTGYNTATIGEELTLEAAQLYFFERDTYRMARTCRPMIEGDLSILPTEDNMHIGFECESADWDRNVYDKPYEEGDTVALISIGAGKYLVLGKIIAGEDVVELDEQIETDWALPDSGEEG